GVELFRYRRSHFGANLDLDQTWTDGQRTQAKAFAATSQAGKARREIILMATGGAMYFLRDGNIFEGTERVRLVVRDQLTGARLMELPQARNTDYRIDYQQGRLTFA